ncbi:MAG: TetR/AcrR family transcriptional regulator [Phycisphaerales bacterium]
MPTQARTSKRAQLIDAALELFDAGGFHATGIDAIIARAGVAKMTLYKHFGSKEELIVAALDRRSEDALACLRERVESSSDDPEQRLLAIYDVAQQQCAERGWRGCTFLRASGEFGDAGCAIHAAAAKHGERMLRYITELCQSAGIERPNCLAQQLLVLHTGAVASAQIAGAADPVCGARSTAKILIDAARARA